MFGVLRRHTRIKLEHELFKLKYIYIYMSGNVYFIQLDRCNWKSVLFNSYRHTFVHVHI